MKPVFHNLSGLQSSIWGGSAATFVVVASVITGLIMVVIFRYTSDQEAVKRAKDHLQAQLLAVRLFQDQLSVVMHSYGRILRGTGRYLKVSAKPLVIMIVPITLLIIQLDRWLGVEPVQPGQAFLVKAQVAAPADLDTLTLNLPEGVAQTAPAVHVPQDRRVVWRLVAEKYGTYPLAVALGGQTFSKELIVSGALARVSGLRTQSFWDSFLSSTEPRLPQGGALQSIEINYPERSIGFLGWQWNWLVLFFVLSLIAGFALKSVLGIEI